METKEKISLTFTALLVFCALIITGFVIRQEFFLPEPQPEIQKIENWQQLDFNGQRIGPEDASVQIVEFFDYQCPYCKDVHTVVKNIRQKYPANVSVRYEHFPLSNHDYAFEAAVAVECAGKQNKFNDYHDLLFINQDRIANLRYDSLAIEAGVENIDSFNSCLESKKTSPIIESGLDLAEQLGINGTPTFLINGKLISGALSEQMLEGFIQEVIK